ncbi:hypothetical protein GCM10025780_29900 [Frondihabitans cladoniiphilus]|uniref:RES domain-containing protein n=1 Tax=Frondihabitans cladoniiphilus TaxID=715785 RepID=A0ABP8W724_9MICO
MWRIGYAPEPWRWVDWRHANGKPFTGRWDSPDANYRTIYAGSTLMASLVEVLARFRRDPLTDADMGTIIVDEVDAALYPTVPAGVVDPGWFDVRLKARATLSGSFADVAAASTVAALRPVCLPLARDRYRAADFDISTLQDSGYRELTQLVGKHLYEKTDPDGTADFDGIRFLSRHGADLELWTLFERSTGHDPSALLTDLHSAPVLPSDPDVKAALALHGLTVD